LKGRSAEVGEFLIGMLESLFAAIPDWALKGLMWGGGFVLGVLVLLSLLSPHG
jgi:hypothetical protein